LFQSSLESFSKHIGSQHGIVSDTRENSLYNAIWAAQALLRKGYYIGYGHTLHTVFLCEYWLLIIGNIYTRSAKTVDKRILLFTNDDDPFGSIKGAAKSDMIRMTRQRAKVPINICFCL